MAEIDWTAVPGGELAWRSDGDGDPVVLVHAGVADMRMWDGLVPILGGTRRLIRFDMRGFGRSRSDAGSFRLADDVLAVFDGLGLARAAVVGASFGALVALEFAAIAPQRVERLVLLAPPLPDMGPSAELRAFWEAEERALDEGRLEDAVELNVSTWVDRSCSDPAVRRLVADMQANAFGLQLATEIEFEEIDPPVSERLAAMAMPVTVAVGDRDLPDFIATAERVACEVPGAGLHRVAGAGHLLALERPEEIAALILAALS